VSHVAGGHGEALAAELAAIDFSGVMLVVGPDGVLAEVALGDADRANGRPNTMATRFPVASVGKLFTAVAIVQQVERGALTLDAKAVDLLPADRRPSGLDAGVTIEHLLTHQSGLEDYIDDAGGADFATLFVNRSPAQFRGPADLLALFEDRPPRALPGAEVRYNDGGFVLLGLILEQVTGRDYYELIVEDVFAPAGMTDSGFPAMDAVVPNVAIGYLRPEHEGEAWRTNVYATTGRGMPDGGAVTTATDLVAFVDAFLAGRLVGDHWRDEMLRPHAWYEEDEVHIGLGWQMGGEGRTRWIGHSGGDPGVGADVSWFPEAGIRTVLITNAPPGAMAAYRAMEAELFPEEAPAASGA
jgi:CubicO group peptidase (beta-lactamase class C family)